MNHKCVYYTFFFLNGDIPIILPQKVYLLLIKTSYRMINEYFQYHQRKYLYKTEKSTDKYGNFKPH